MHTNHRLLPRARRAFLPATLLALVLVSLDAAAADPERIARAVSVQGTVELQRAGRPEWAPLKLDEGLSAGDTVRVGPRSRAVLALLDRSVLRLAEGTTVKLAPPGPERSGVVDLLRGLVHFLTRGPRSLDVKTELVNVGVRGTEFLVSAEPDVTSVTVFEGAVVAANEHGTLELAGGQSAVARRGQPPVLQLVARPRDAVRWALHYPPVLDVRPEDLAREAGAQDRLRVSVAAWRQGDVAGALAPISEVPPPAADARLLTYRAQVLLAVGRVDEAGADLDRALAASPKDPAALSLQTVVAVVQNDRDRALSLGRAAVEAAPASATAQLALSYALQARFDLAGARASAERATALDAKDALAWARLAELRASFGERGAALEAAQRASALAPDLSRTRTVLGFAELANVDPRGAEQEFERAIALDSADPLPRLGLGLARVRRGALDQGARDVEIAANLAPNDALVRSYLGKAYFEEKRAGLDEREYATARGLDPLDPTPWFYGAISKQASNRPVEALWDLERANDLNDGRGVYRSRLLLDSDLAARSASLARIYGDLGFQELALREGWRSVETDPTSDSAHRLLADSYAALPRHEVARVSELLQAQLLQPINVTPIQPRLAESNLLLAARGGPGLPSFNEFNPLFERDRAVLQVNGFGGDRSTTGIEPVVAGLYRNVSFSAGYTRFRTDGFRVNGDQQDDLYNAFVQAELSSQTSVQAEYRRRENDRGDLQSYFFPELVRPTFRQSSDRDTYRLGARHALSDSSVVLASATYQHSRDHNADLPAIEVAGHQDSIGGELQHLFRSRFVDLVSGAGYFYIEGSSVLTIPLFGIEQNLEGGGRHANGYAYAHARLPARVTLTLGLSADAFRTRDDTVPSKDRLNPKLGAVWTPLRGTTVRAAAFRALKRTLITDQTLEPTQIAGFNQFFDDANVSTSWRYGLGIDQRLTQGLFAGVEGSRRDLTAPVFDPTTNGFQDLTSKEYEARGYVFWTPLPWLAVRTGYSFDRLVGGNAAAASEARTHRVPLGVAAFLPFGVSATSTVSYYRQDGDFSVPSFGPTPAFQEGRSDFWLLDAGLGWRLPRRYGLLSVVGTNLTDKNFQLFEQSSTNGNPTVQPGRAVFARITLNAP